MPVISWTPHSILHFWHTLGCVFYGSWCMAWGMTYRTASPSSEHLHTSSSDDKPIGTGVISPVSVRTYTYCYISSIYRATTVYLCCSGYPEYLRVMMYVIDTTNCRYCNYRAVPSTEYQIPGTRYIYILVNMPTWHTT